jgi:hypothetical protein
MKIPSMIAAAAAALLALPAHAQDPVSGQLAEAATLFSGQGLTATADSLFGALAADGEAQFTFQMQEGLRYMVLGVCDGDCTDMDMTLSDANGRVIVEDRAPDDVPLLAVEGSAGTYTVKVMMAACGSQACRYGVRVFQGAQQ